VGQAFGLDPLYFVLLPGGGSCVASRADPERGMFEVLNYVLMGLSIVGGLLFIASAFNE
jgi:hypothetical protein